MKIGVFDSGVGGLSVANAIKEAFPDDQVVLREDKAHVPYGTRQPSEILGFVVPIFQELVDEGCQVIVIACNTVSTNLIQELRAKFSLPLIPVEPMVQAAAAATKSRTIAICATPATLKSERYAWLKSKYTSGLKVLEPDCSDWALMIQEQNIDRQKIANRINQVLNDGADVIVLGCTHYHWIETEIKNLAQNRAQVIQPEATIIEQLRQVLAQRP